MKGLTFAASAIIACAVSASAAIGPSDTARLTAAAQVVRDVHATIPQQYWEQARCVAVIPGLKKAAFIVGGEYGRGVMSCRAGDLWSAPMFLELAKGSWGFQAGAEQVDVVLLIVNEQGVQKLLQNKVNLGVDASVAAGPIGRQGQVGTDAQLTAEILSYSRAQGLFAGIDLSGGVLRPDEDANRSAYGKGATPRTILATREISAPTQAASFLAALAGAFPAATTAVQPPTTATTMSAPTPTSTGPVISSASDIRSRIAEMQQTLDRLLADRAQEATATAATTGTTGALEPRSNRTVTVDRAQLVQLRQQLDALMTALDRRR